jgi:hypothetical protein
VVVLSASFRADSAISVVRARVAAALSLASTAAIGTDTADVDDDDGGDAGAGSITLHLVSGGGGGGGGGSSSGGDGGGTAVPDTTTVGNAAKSAGLAIGAMLQFAARVTNSNSNTPRAAATNGGSSNTKVMVITGASSGLGAHLVSHFANTGGMGGVPSEGAGAGSNNQPHQPHHQETTRWQVVAIARGEERLRDVCSRALSCTPVAGGGGGSGPLAPACFPCDISDKSQVQATVTAVLEQYGRIDVLINNAGVAQDGKKFW